MSKRIKIGTIKLEFVPKRDSIHLGRTNRDVKVRYDLASDNVYSNNTFKLKTERYIFQVLCQGNLILHIFGNRCNNLR